MVQSRVRGTISHCVEPDCSRWRDSNSSVHRKSLTRYRSAFEFWRKRKRSTESRNWMCSGTRSHWRSWSSCVTWSWFSFYNKTVRDVINMVIFKQKCFSFWGTKSIKRFIPVPIGGFPCLFYPAPTFPNYFSMSCSILRLLFISLWADSNIHISHCILFYYFVNLYRTTQHAWIIKLQL